MHCWICMELDDKQLIIEYCQYFSLINRPNTWQNYDTFPMCDCNCKVTSVPDPPDLSLWGPRCHPWSVSGICHRLQCFCCLCPLLLHLGKERDVERWLKVKMKAHQAVRSLFEAHCMQSGNKKEMHHKSKSQLETQEVSGVWVETWKHTPVKLSVFLSFCSCRAPDTISNVVL